MTPDPISLALLILPSAFVLAKVIMFAIPPFKS